MWRWTIAGLFAMTAFAWPAFAACPPYSTFRSAEATRLGSFMCAEGIQQQQELELFSVEKSGFGTVSIAVLVAQHEEQRMGGLIIRVGPMGQYESFQRGLVDQDEVKALAAYFDDAISYSASSEPPVKETRAMIYRTRDGWEFTAFRGSLGGVSLALGRRTDSNPKVIDFSPDETRNLHSLFNSAQQTLSELK